MFHYVRRSLKWKLISIITAIIVVIVASIGFFSYYETSKTIRADVERFSRQVLRQANLNLNRYYNEYEQELLIIGSSKEFRNWLHYDSDDKLDLVMAYYSMRSNNMNAFLEQHPEIMSITLFSNKGVQFNYAPVYDLDKDYDLNAEPWLPTIVDTGKFYIHVDMSKHYLYPDGTIQPLHVMTMAKRFGDDGYLKMDISLNTAQKILSEINIGARQIGVISDDDGNILVHPEGSMIGSKLDEDIVQSIKTADSGFIFHRETDEMIIFETIPLTHWKTLAFVPYHDVAGSIEKVRTVTILIALLGLIVSVLLVIGVTTSITKRLTNMRNIIKKTQLGRFDLHVAVSGMDEVADVGLAYNRMLTQLGGSIQQLTDSKLSQQKAILSALQSQINSHFLYNTLATIHSLADLAGQREIESMAVALSRMLRYTSSYTSEIVSAQDEIRHLTDYLQIIAIRFTNSVTYQIDVDPACAEADCLKAILQPMVENSIKHGIEQTGQPIHLDIRVGKLSPNRIFITVSDTGSGFSDAKLAELQRQMKGSDTWSKYNELVQVGLLNVHYRLNMYYPDGLSGIGIANEPGGGAMVTLTFPLSYNRKRGD